MNLFEAVKQDITTRQAAEAYGLRVNRAGKTNCPFHHDRTPSMKVDKRFHCFGCGADGDVIDFTAKLYGLNAKSAAEKLAADFQIPYTKNKGKDMVKKAVREKTDEQMYRELEAKCFRVLSDYYHLLRQWEQVYAPDPKDTQWHPLFVEALQKKDHMEYLLDTLLSGDMEERAQLIMEYGKDVIQLEKRMDKLAAPDTASLEKHHGCYAAAPECRGSESQSGFDGEGRRPAKYSELPDRISA